MAENFVLDRPNKTGWVHPIVKNAAIELAQQLYEKLAKDNNWYAVNGEMDIWVQTSWGDLIPAARAILAKTLSSPSISVEMKDTIADALIQDHSLRHGRNRAQQRRRKGLFR